MLLLRQTPWLPEVLEISKSQAVSVLGDIVSDIHDQASVLATIPRAAQSAAHHLLIQTATVDWSRNH